MSSLLSSYLLEPVRRGARRYSANPNDVDQHGDSDDGTPRASRLRNIRALRNLGSLQLASNSEDDANGAKRRRSLDDMRDGRSAGETDEETDEEREERLQTTRVPEVARENGFQGLIPLSDLRGDYTNDEPPSPAGSQPMTDADLDAAPLTDAPVTAEPSSMMDTTTVSSFSMMSLDSGPHDRSSNPSFSVGERLSSRPNSYNSVTNRMSMDGRSRRSAEQVPQRSREGSTSGASNMSESLPADDGMKELRAKILQIRDMALSSEEKARRMHNLMITDYKRFRNSEKDARKGTRSPRASRGSRSYHSSTISMDDDADIFKVKPRDLQPSYRPRSPPQTPETPCTPDSDHATDEEEQRLGCVHYLRNIKVQCSNCRRWYPCRLCHDAEVEDHRLERKKIENMLCMLCGTPQPAGENCMKCGEEAAIYYCDICKLWDNDARKRIYHCPDCGICRRGEGLGRDYFHCKRCNVCISIRWAEEHKCVERATECDCPICGEYMFTSSGDVVAVRCGHYMHKDCYNAYMDTNYRCPMCGRSMVNMALQWRKLDDQIVSQPMPSEFAATQAFVSCNDCAGKSCVPYHWLGLKCATCDSYNTVRLSLVNAPEHQPVADPSPTEITARDAIRSHSNPEPAVPAIDTTAPLTVSRSADAAPPADQTEPIAAAPAGIPIPPRTAPAFLAHSPTGTNSTVVVSHHGASDDEAVMLDAADAEAPTEESLDEDEDLDFWGAASPGWISPPSWMSPRFLATRKAQDDADVASDEDSSSGDSMDEDAGADDDDEEVDDMDIFGHR